MLILCVAAAVSQAPSHTSDKRTISSSDFPKPLGPYSQAVVAGGFVFIAGQGPIDPKTQKMELGKREKFVKLAENRTKNALKAIRVIAKLGNKNAYDYSEADVRKIAGALTKEVETLKARMLSTGGKDVVDFKLGN